MAGNLPFNASLRTRPSNDRMTSNPLITSSYASSSWLPRSNMAHMAEFLHSSHIFLFSRTTHVCFNPKWLLTPSGLPSNLCPWFWTSHWLHDWLTLLMWYMVCVSVSHSYVWYLSRTAWSFMLTLRFSLYYTKNTIKTICTKKEKCGDTGIQLKWEKPGKYLCTTTENLQKS